MITNKIQSIWKSRLGFGILMFIIGGTVSYFFAPEKIKIKIETKIEYKDKIVEKEVIKYVEKEVIKYEKVRVVKRKVTWPDGKIEEEEIYESESEQIDRMTEKYAELLKQKEIEYTKKYEYLKEHLRPKRLNLFAGLRSSITELKRPYYLGGFNYNVWGPFTIGAIVDTQPSAGVLIGIQF